MILPPFVGAQKERKVNLFFFSFFFFSFFFFACHAAPLEAIWSSTCEATGGKLFIATTPKMVTQSIEAINSRFASGNQPCMGKLAKTSALVSFHSDGRKRTSDGKPKLTRTLIFAVETTQELWSRLSRLPPQGRHGSCLRALAGCCTCGPTPRTSLAAHGWVFLFHF
jgi:hypothetical protein